MLVILLSLVIILITAQSPSVNALGPSHSFRSGTVFLKDPESASVHQEILVNFQFVFQSSPLGIVLSPRVLETQNETLCIDYHLASQLISETGFQLVIKLSQIHPILYNKIIINYLTISPTFSRSMAISSLQQHSPGTTTIQGSVKKLEWRIQSQSIMNQQAVSCNSKHYISRLCACASANNLSITQKQTYQANTTSVVVEYSIVSNEGFEIDVSAIIYANNWVYGNLYLLTRSLEFKVKSQVNEFNDAVPYATLFIGIKSFTTLTSPSKVSFNFGYQVEYIENNTLTYRQSHPQTYLSLNQSAEDSLHFSIELIGSTVYQCVEAGYANNLVLTSQCFKKCPLGRYSNSIKYCINCFDKNNNQSAIGECYENGCAEGSYFDVSGSVPKCTSCRDAIPYCKKCGNSPGTSPQCQRCIQEFFINSTDKRCYLCNEAIEGCEVCSMDASYCLKYTDTDPQQQEPSQCNSPSYVDPSDNQCKLCSSQIENCVECSSDQQFRCQKCNPDFSLYEIEDCTDCVRSVFVDSSTRQCRGCSQYCTQCYNASYCLSCYTSPQFSTRLYADTCIECNNNQTDFLSQLPLCSISIGTLCLFSKYNPKLKTCQYTDKTKEAMALFTTLASFNLHAIFKQLLLIFILFEDFSYYSFHQRNYSKIINSFLLEMTTFTLTRFKPNFIKALYTMVNADFERLNLKETPKKIPSKYVMYGKGLHYTTTTQDIWVGNLPMHIGVLALLLFVRWVIGRFKSGFGDKYNIPSFIIVTWVDSNFQYLCFRSFCQLYQITPFNPIYALNLLANYSVLLVLLVYAAGGSFLYKSAYQQLFSKGYFQVTRKKKWIVYWTANNLLKIAISFAHAAFFYHPLLQCSLLLSFLLLKGGIFAVFMRPIKSSMEYIIELTGMMLFIATQLLFLIEIVMKMAGEYTVSSEVYIGNLEYIMVMMMVFSEFVLVIVKLVAIAASAVAERARGMWQKKQREVRRIGIIEKTSAGVQYRISPVDDVSAIDDISTSSLQEVNLENDTAVAIPSRYQRLHIHRNGFIGIPNRSITQPPSISPITPLKKPTPHPSSRPYDYDFSSAIETISFKIKEREIHKNKSKKSKPR